MSHSNTKVAVFSEHASTGGWRRPSRAAAAQTAPAINESRRGDSQSEQVYREPAVNALTQLEYAYIENIPY